MSNINPGPKLFFSRFGGEQPIPPEFVAAMERREEVQSVPNDVEAEGLSDEIVESKVETNRKNERVRTTVKKKSGNIVLRSVNTNEKGQPVQVVRTLHPTGTASPLPGTTQNVAEQDLGNGWSILEVSTEGAYVGGVFVPGLFPADEYTRERPDITPEEFRVAAQTVTNEHRVEGIAQDPVLIANDLARRETQETSFVKRVFRKFRDAVLGTTLVHYDTDGDKEVITVSRELKAAGTPSAPTALLDVKTINLGDGRMVEERYALTEVFGGEVFEKARPDIVPEEFKVAIPVITTETTSAGTAATPTLSSGELQRAETQVKKFVKRVRLVARALASLGTSLTSYRTNPEKLLETITSTYKLLGTPTAPSALTEVSVKNLGDGTVIEEVTTVPEVFGGEVFEKQRPDTVPEKFKVAIPVSTTETTSAGTAAAVTLGSGELERQETQVKKFIKRVRVVFRSAAALGTSLISYRTTQDKQLETVTSTYKLVGTPTTPSATVDVVTDNLGDGTMVEEVMSVPSVFGQNVFEKARPDTVPEKFKVAIPAETTEVTVAGDAAAVTLGSGELERQETQVKQFLKRVRVVFRAAATLGTSLVSYRTNAAQQLETVTSTYKLFGTPTVPTATTDVTTDNLGDGRMIEEVASVPRVFDNSEFTAEIPDLVPVEFRAALPIIESSITTSGTAAAPTLGIGELSRRDVQVRSFWRRLTVRSRTVASLPQTLTDKTTEEDYGGGESKVFKTIGTAGTLVLESGLTIFRSIVRAIGGGLEVRETTQLDAAAFPILSGTEILESIAIPTTQQVVAAGTTGGVTVSGADTFFTAVTPIDKWRSLKRTKTINKTNIMANFFKFANVIDIDLPLVLLGVRAVYHGDAGGGTSQETGSIAVNGPGGTVGIDAGGTAEANATQISDIVLDIKRYPTQNIEVNEILLFVDNQATHADIRTRISLFLGGVTINPWPKFTPKSHTIECYGVERRYRATANVHVSNSQSIDSHGVYVGQSTAQSTGAGNSLSTGVSLKLVTLPETIHGALGITGLSNMPASAEASVFISIAGNNAGGLIYTAEATAVITPTTVPSSGNTVAIPMGGIYVYKMRTELFEGYMLKVHATIIDMGQFAGV